LYLLQKMTRALGSGSIDFRPRRRDFSADGKLAGMPWLGLRLSEIKDLDSALVVGSFLRKDHPLFAQRLRQLGKKWGKVSLLSVGGDDPLIRLHAQLTVSPPNCRWRWRRSSRRRRNSGARRCRRDSIRSSPAQPARPSPSQPARRRKAPFFWATPPSRIRTQRNCTPWQANSHG
jgi:NADH dehydrogenase/NADH:ubiquinone oxidoreductase subunit G